MSDAKWKLMVDWQGAGEFAGADDDITPAALSLSLQHIRDLRSEYIDPARLDIRLANIDHKYSPPNTASPLFGALKPGRKVWLRAAFPCDEFGDIAGTSLADHAPEYGAAYRWTDANHDFRIAAEGGAQTNGVRSGRRVATMDFGLADVSFGCDFTRGSNATRHGGLTLRYSDADNFLYVRVMPSAVQVRKVEQGSDAPVAESALQWSAGDKNFIQAELHGDSIRVLVDEKQVIAARLGFNRTATRHGLYCDGAADHLWQQFGGWVSLFYGDVESIDPQPGTGQCRIRAYDEMRRLESVTLYMSRHPHFLSHPTIFSTTSWTTRAWMQNIAGWMWAQKLCRSYGVRRSGACRPRTRFGACRMKRTASSMWTGTGSGAWRVAVTVKRHHTRRQERR